MPYTVKNSVVSQNKPLKGVRIIDAGNLVAAPFAAVLMADLGADVIKIEHPKMGDGQRKLGPSKDGIPLWWKTISRNKRCITLDLSDSKGAAVFKDLVRGADIIMENFRPGTMDRWGIGYEAIKAIEPKAIMLSISGFGQNGPYANRPGFGRIAEAMSGLTYLIGDADGPPMSPGYPLGDLISGLFGAFSAMVALHSRNQLNGKGQSIDLALYEALFRLMDFDPILYDQTSEIHKRSGNQVAYVAPSSTYKTLDGSYITMAASTNSAWLRLCEAMDRNDLPTNKKYITNQDRVALSNEINGIVAQWFAKHTRAKIIQCFDKHEVAYSVIFNIQDIFQDPQYAARDAMVRVPDDDLGAATVQNVVPKFSLTPGSVDFLGAHMGAHNNIIYAEELGYSESKINQLRKEGII